MSNALDNFLLSFSPLILLVFSPLASLSLLLLCFFGRLPIFLSLQRVFVFFGANVISTTRTPGGGTPL